MKYSQFETLAFVLGAFAISASIFLTPGTATQGTEVAAQLLLIVVLAGALHWGRNGGFWAAMLSIVVYIGMRLPLLLSDGLTSDMLTLLGTRAVTYGLIGVVGGELAGRIKYLFARLESDTLIDDTTGVYSARYAAGAITSGIGQWERYQTQFSLVQLEIAPAVYSSLKAPRSQQLMRQVATHVRGDIRMVDDLSFDPPGSFLVLLPKTDAAGADVAARRLRVQVTDVLGAREEMLSTTVLSAETDATALKALAESLCPGLGDGACSSAVVEATIRQQMSRSGEAANRRQEPSA